MCSNKEDIYMKSNWDGALGISRSKLLESLQGFRSDVEEVEPQGGALEEQE